MFMGYKKDQLYVTIFEGDKSDGLSVDSESYNFWKEFLPEERILYGSKKDNFGKWGKQDHVDHAQKFILT